MGSTFYTPSELADLLAAAGFRVSLIETGFEYTLVGRLDNWSTG